MGAKGEVAGVLRMTEDRLGSWTTEGPVQVAPCRLLTAASCMALFFGILT